MTQKREKDVVGIVTFDPITFFSPITLLFMLQWHIGVYEEKFDVNRKWLKQRKIFEISLSQSRVL